MVYFLLHIYVYIDLDQRKFTYSFLINDQSRDPLHVQPVDNRWKTDFLNVMLKPFGQDSFWLKINQNIYIFYGSYPLFYIT
jgi:hypothetical protein